jgi:ATP-dependent Clp protease adapter protein ClpS
MEFVVLALREKLGMGKNESIDTMLGIHRNGGVLLPTSTTDEATRIADAIVADARAKDFPLVCRAVSVVGS